MSKLLRYHRSIDTCFVTSVTNARQRILSGQEVLLTAALEKHAARHGFKIIAYVILPDHFHALLECNGNDLSNIMQRVKLSFSKCYRNRTKVDTQIVWQRRFWDHIIRNQADMNRHIDYIHYNPVKHGLVDTPFNWVYSSIHEFRREGYYSDDWGDKGIVLAGEFGEE